MSAEIDLIQAARDMDFYGADYYSGGFKEALERAKKAARELFPPMAKPLVWVSEPTGDFYDETVNYRIEFRTAVYGKYLAQTESRSICGVVKSWSVNGSLEACKAACESHHQARFKELLA